MMAQINWADDRLPAASRFPVQIIRARHNLKIQVRFLGGFDGVYTHWLAGQGYGRSMPCLTDNCPHCNAQSQRVWKGYAPIQFWARLSDSTQKWVTGILELTESLIPHLQQELRGRIASIGRANKSPRSPVTLEWLEKIADHELPEPFDVKPTLIRLWGYQHAQIEATTETSDRTATIPFRKQA